MQQDQVVRRFIVVGMLLALPALVALLSMDRYQFHVAMNAVHTPWADVFFRYFTHVADGLVPTALALAMLAVSYRAFLMVGLSCGISAIVAQVLKRQVFAHMHRPVRFQEELGNNMRWVNDLELHHHFSFPSGHATAAFSMCLALAVVIGGRRWAIPLALLAGLLAYSRVYLSQHFTEDVLAGAAVGTATAYVVYRWLYRSSFSHKPWLDRRAFQRPK